MEEAEIKLITENGERKLKPNKKAELEGATKNVEDNAKILEELNKKIDLLLAAQNISTGEK